MNVKNGDRETIIPWFSKDLTNSIKGIAIISMLLHHFFSFPEWWLNPYQFPIIASIADSIRAPLAICVPVFAFLTGYTYCFQQRKNYRYSLHKIFNLLICYWVVFVILAIASVITVHWQYSFLDVLKELLAIYRPTMVFCWYVNFYIILMLILPLISKFFGRFLFLDIVFIVAFPYILLRIVKFIPINWIQQTLSSLASYLPCVLTGYLFARHQWFQQIDVAYMRLIKRKWLDCIICVFLLLIAFAGRFIEPSITVVLPRLPIILDISLDVLYAPMLVFAVVRLCRDQLKTIPVLKKGLQTLGDLSLPMWFVHCIFFNNAKTFFQPLLYAPRNPVLVAVWGIGFTAGAAYFILLLVKKLIQGKDCLWNLLFAQRK